jgi:hypothetical protein
MQVVACVDGAMTFVADPKKPIGGVRNRSRMFKIIIKLIFSIEKAYNGTRFDHAYQFAKNQRRITKSQDL